MEIKDQKIIDTLADTLGVDKENLKGVKILSPEEHEKHLKNAISASVNDYFKRNFLKRIDSEMARISKTEGEKWNHLLLTLSDLRQKCLGIKLESEEIGYCFELSEQLGAVSYAISIAVDHLEGLNHKIIVRLGEAIKQGAPYDEIFVEAKTLSDEDWTDFINSKIKK